MKNTIIKWFKKYVAVRLVLVIVFIGVMPAAHASTAVNITDNEQYMDSRGNHNFKYCLNADAYVTAGVYEADGAYSSKIIDIFTAQEYKSAGCYTESWDVTYGQYSESGTPGSRVAAAAGDVFYGVRAEGVNAGSGEDYVSDWVNVVHELKLYPVEDLKFLDIETKNRTFNPKEGQKGEITFITTEDSYITLDIFDKDDDSAIIQTLVDATYFYAGEHALSWDGRDIYGQTAAQGEYKYRLVAQNAGDQEVVIGSLKVKYSVYGGSNSTQDPRLQDVFVVKDSFDSGRNEKARIVFTLTAEADVQVTISNKSGQVIDTILDKHDRAPGTYVVEWSGAYEEGTYTYQIYAENSAGYDAVHGKIKIKDDGKSGKKPNILKDRPSEIPFKPKFNNVYFNFALDRDADVTIEIRDGKRILATVISDRSLNEGQHKIGWDGRNSYGDYVENGIYQYKIKAENYSGSDVEKGNFSVEQTGEAKHLYGGCGTFNDVDEYFQYCTAIKWAEGQGVFNGYNDGTFKPNQPITRVEALKVILEAMDINTINAKGQALGFKDTNPHAWYASYLQTALSLGVVNGYNNGYFLPGNYISRAESLKIILEAGEVKYNVYIPTKTNGNPYLDTPSNKWYISYVWFAKAYGLTGSSQNFYPTQNMTRGEMADMLYRYNKNIK